MCVRVATKVIAFVNDDADREDDAVIAAAVDIVATAAQPGSSPGCAGAKLLADFADWAGAR